MITLASQPIVLTVSFTTRLDGTVSSLDLILAQAYFRVQFHWAQFLWDCSLCVTIGCNLRHNGTTRIADDPVALQPTVLIISLQHGWI